MAKYDNKTLNERETNYGDFSDNAEISQRLKVVVHSGRSWAQCNDTQKEALEMICTKISRIMGGDPDYVDNWHDIIGYAELAQQEIKKRTT